MEKIRNFYLTPPVFLLKVHTSRRKPISFPYALCLLLFAFSLMPFVSFAQQQLMTSHDYINPSFYNPAAIGTAGYMKVNLHARRQWTGIQGAPETYLLTADGELENKKVGLAVGFYNDITDIISRLSGGIGYRYKVSISGEDHNISFGLMANIIQNSIRFDKIRTDNLSDQTLFYNRESRTSFDVNAGALYHFKNFEAGFSTYQLLANKLVYTNQIDEKSLSFRFIRHFRAMLTYNYSLNNNFSIEPRVVMKGVQGMPLQFDMGAYTLYNKKLWAGIVWQQHYGLSFSVGGDFYNRYTFGYSYDIALGSIRHFTRGSHEIVLGVKLFRNRATTDGKISNTAPDEELEKLKQISKEQYEQIEKLDAENKLMKQELENTNQDIETQKEEMQNLKQIFSADSAAIKAVVKKYSTSLEELVEPKSRYKKMNNVYIDTTIEASNTNMQFYIVLGTFMKYSDARLLQKILAREAKVETKITSDIDNTFFVYSTSFVNATGVKSKIKRHINDLEKKGVGKYIQGDIWIYKMKR